MAHVRFNNFLFVLKIATGSLSYIIKFQIASLVNLPLVGAPVMLGGNLPIQ